MSTTTTVIALNRKHAPHQGADLYAFEVTVLVDGTYATASKPNFDLLAALKAQHQAQISAVAVKRVTTLQDYNDGTNVYTASNAVTALSSTGNKVITFTIESGATDGDTGTEISDSTALHGCFSFLVVTTLTGL